MDARIDARSITFRTHAHFLASVALEQIHRSAVNAGNAGPVDLFIRWMSAKHRPGKSSI